MLSAGFGARQWLGRLAIRRLISMT